ncbi:glycoside hydrolase family 5 protein [Treponema sp.]|uniref:glycoside hydrolase family 5 protein n=1 Tax=Treponema sp. TaxID=166 RepID=UPI00257C5BF2|nr:glycoside hydrolase family 5 protein [Treponema sp.]MBE6355267.1 glycoside hydrolase family 5 protein [Treponema sp.]
MIKETGIRCYGNSMIKCRFLFFMVTAVCFAGCASVKSFPAETAEVMGDGINIGNTLDVITDKDGNGTDETGWGNPVITRDYIKFLKASGFKTIRLPVTWAEHMSLSDDYVIEEKWMSRVSEVVEWIIQEKMYVIINLHHDGGSSRTSWIQNKDVPFEQRLDRYKKVWMQIADNFGDVNHNLIFEAMNEVGFDGWSDESYVQLNAMNQAFVDVVRSSGRKNSDRKLMISGYWTDIDASCDSRFKMPSDTAADSLMLSVHYYTPSSFTISMDKENQWWYSDTWGNDSDFAELKSKFEKLKLNYIDKGIPVVIGEYGCIDTKDFSSTVLWLKSVRKICHEFSVVPVLWENGKYVNRKFPFGLRSIYAEMLK